jgi:predicted DNA-binding protein
MGMSTRWAVQVPESTRRKAKTLAAAFGIPVSDIVKQAIEEMAENHKEQVLLALHEEVKDD